MYLQFLASGMIETLPFAVLAPHYILFYLKLLRIDALLVCVYTNIVIKEINRPIPKFCKYFYVIDSFYNKKMGCVKRDTRQYSSIIYTYTGCSLINDTQQNCGFFG